MQGIVVRLGYALCCIDKDAIADVVCSVFNLSLKLPPSKLLNYVNLLSSTAESVAID